MAAGDGSDQYECQSCGERFNMLSMHWRRGGCEYPKPTEQQRDLLAGLLLGDADIDARSDVSSLRVRMTNKDFLMWLSERFPELSIGLFFESDGVAESQRAAKNGFGNPGYQFKDMYGIRFWANPYFNELRDRWYSGSTKIYPTDIEFSKDTVRMWYVCDGGLSWNDTGCPRVHITAINEHNRMEWLLDMFDSLGFEVKSPSSGVIRFPASSTRELLDWMGSPPSGFEYKWETYSREKYESLMPE